MLPIPRRIRSLHTPAITRLRGVNYRLEFGSPPLPHLTQTPPPRYVNILTRFILDIGRIGWAV